jgi:nifR3 family TIM-barrel protein
LKFDLPNFLNSARNKAILAPLAGLSDSALRTICREWGAGFTVSEMVSAEGLVRKVKKTLQLLNFTPAERPFGIQLYSNDADNLAKATEIISALNPDFIDLNCGCPARKVVKRGAGASLMSDLSHLEAIMQAMRSATKLPLTAKFRSGIDDSKQTVAEASKIAEGAGFSAVTVHARTLKQGFKGNADWKVIAEVKKSLSITVIGNGDICSAEDAKRMFAETACDMVMVGRGALGNPWLFSEIAGNIQEITSEIRFQTIHRHYQLMLASKAERIAVREMRKHLIWYSKKLPGSAEFRKIITTMESPDEVLEEVERFFK